MENLTPGEIVVLIIGGLLALAGFINTVGSAAEKIAKAVSAAKAPNAHQDERLDALEEWRKEVDRKLNNDKEQLDEIHAGLQASYQAQLALLDHGIDGNNIKQMQDAKQVLQQHLISKK